MGRFDSWRLTVMGIQDLLEFYGTVFGLLLLLYLFASGLYHEGLLNPTEVVSVFIAEAPLGVGLWWVLGERSHGRFADAIDSITLGEKYDNLTVHYWILGWWIFVKTFCAVENKSTQLAYDCPPFLEELGNKGIVHRVKHAGEPELRKYFEDNKITLVEREATFAELRP